MTEPLLGIAFSGTADDWGARKRNSSVYVASGLALGDRLQIADLRTVQTLDGEGEPFERLIALLASANGYAGIDAPFGAPQTAASAAMTWALAAGLPRDKRPFGKGADLVAKLAPTAGKHGLKAYRTCDDLWRRRGLTARSTMWSGPGGAASALAGVMMLLARRAGPVWPMRQGAEGAVVVEAYPAAQLLTWGLPSTGYAGPKPAAEAARLKIVHALVQNHGLRGADDILGLCASNAGALDAVLSAYAAKTLADGRHPRRLPSQARSEGWIVVDEDAANLEGLLVAPTIEVGIRRHLDSLFDALASEDEPAE